MDENSKKTPSYDELDRFWDISSLTPRSRSVGHRKPQSVEAVEITLDTPAPNADAVGAQPLTKTAPLEGVQSDRRTTSRSATAPQTAHAMEEPPEPEQEYTPAHQMIRRVRVYGKSGVYNYYEQFLNHARKIGGLQGRECGHTPFFSYVPQFSQLTKPQLDWYLWWRESLWNGHCLETDFSYILLYIYEIINTDGHGNPTWGQRQLCTVWRHYRRVYPRLDRLLGDWICDFSLLHRLPPPVRQLGDMLGEALPSCTLKEFYMTADDTNSMSAPRGQMLITFCSNYNYQNSKFCTGDNKSLYDEHIPRIVELLADKFTDQQGRRLLSTDAVAAHHIVRDAYAGALCSFAIRKRLEIDYSSFSRSYELRFMVTDSVKYSENKLRGYLGIKSRLNAYSVTPEIKKCIDEYFAEVLPGQRKSVPRREEYERLYDAPQTPISLENAALIELTSWETTEKLIEAFEDETLTEEEKTSLPPSVEVQLSEIPVDQRCDQAASDVSGLAAALGEYMDFLRFADAGDSVAMRGYAAEHGEMLELLIDKINEMSVDIFGDVILEEAGDCYAIIPEYRKELFND